MPAALKLLLIPIVAYLAIVALMYVGQRSLLYLPGQRGASATELGALGLRHWPDEVSYRGYLLDAPSAEATVVVFHGNAGEAIDRRYYVDALGGLVPVQTGPVILAKQSLPGTDPHVSAETRQPRQGRSRA